MKEIIDIRLREKWAQKKFGDNFGIKYSEFTRRFLLNTESPMFQKVRNEIRKEFNKHPGKLVYSSAFEHRLYTKAELANAELFRLDITACFEPAGEEIGIVYDESTACDYVFHSWASKIAGEVMTSYCGGGRKQVSDLYLDLQKIPKKKDIARTIANEKIISDHLALLFKENQITGYELRQVHHYTNKLRNPPLWHQLIVTGNAGVTVTPTMLGDDLITEGPISHVCPKGPEGHVTGLNLLSEVYISKGAWDGQDFTATSNLIGYRLGVLAPTPMILITPKVYRLLKEHDIKGYRVEIAHLV
ncbi:MAG: hypothetical protein ACE14V_16470 [bacterium]